MPFKCALGLVSMLAVQTALAWPDLAVTKTGPAEAAPGEIISYTLIYTNKGPVKSTRVVLEDLLPSHVTVLPETLDDGSISGSTISWSLGTVYSRKGGSRTFQVRINANAPAGGYITNRAEIDGKEAEESGKKSNNSTKLITRIINRPPVAQDDTYSVEQNSMLTVTPPGVLSNDSDPDGHTLKAVLASGPAHGTLTLSTNGGFNYVPESNYTGADSFTYRASDGFTNSNVATVHITITPANSVPVAMDDSYTTMEDTTLTVNAPGVLGNDSDPDGDSLEAMLISSPLHGALTLNPDGSFVYTPTNHYTGSDNFTYHANDGTVDSGVATVNITVTPANDAPVAINDDYTTPEDTPITVSEPGVLGNDHDGDGDVLQAILVSDPLHGTLVLSANGSFTYTPATNYTGSDSFTYQANDGQTDSAIATVSILVTPANDPPVALDDDYTMDEDSTLNVPMPGILANDFDPDGDSIVALLESGPAQGSLLVNPDGSFTYTPTNDYTGSDSFTYRTSDGQTNSNVAVVTITILPANDPPVAVDDAYTTPEDTALQISAPGVLANDTDLDGDVLSAIFVTAPTNGTVTLSTNGSFVYVPRSDFTGQDSFTYRAADGITNSDVAIVVLTITPMNDPPVAVNDNYTTPEDTTLAITGPGVLANDTDLEGDALTAVLLSNPLHGTVTLNSDGSFSYTPSSNYTGPDSFTYKANDGTADSDAATVFITVTPLNDPPHAADDGYSTPEDTPLTVAAPGILANDSDPEGDALESILVNNPTHGVLSLSPAGGFTYVPTNHFNGTDSFAYRAFDEQTNGNVAIVSITVTPVNDAPVAVDDNYSTPEDTPLIVAAPGILANDNDPDGDPLSTLLVSSPSHGALTLTTDGGFVYTPQTNFTGSDSFTYKANDGQTDSGVAMVSITVTPLNDPPVAVNDSCTTPEDTPLTIAAPGVLVNDLDLDGDVLSAIFVSGATHGTVALNTNGGFSYTPATNYTGPDSFRYRVFDGLTNSPTAAIVSITVTPVNDPPVAHDDHYTTTEDTPLNIAAPGVLLNDSDAEGNALNAVLVTGPSHGMLVLNLEGGFAYTPATNYSGPDAFTYKANDGTSDSAMATVSIIVTPLNDPPVASDDNYSTPEDTPLSVTLPGILANDSDPDGDALSALLVGDPSHGILTLNGDGSFTYTPTNDFHGLDQFTYRASDALLHSEVATVTIRVTPVNDPPDTNNWSGHSFTLYEDTVLEVGTPGLLAGIVDLDLDQLRALFESHPLHGTLALNTNGSFIHRPLTNYFGSDSFRFRIGDGQILSPVLTVNLTVLPVNDAPSFTKGPSQFHQQNAGPQTFPAWASHISAGPENEAGQAVGFEVSNDNSALFTVQPALSATGTLTYTLAPEAWGVATVTVVARDDGGTANGGVNSSDPQTFSITVNAPPSVSIVSPTNGASFFVPGSYTLLAEAQDVDGTIEKVELFAGTNKIAEISSGAPYFTVLTNLPVGAYTYGATATDNHGATGTAAPVTVNVIERPPVTFLTSVYYNPQTDFYEQRLRIHNPTYSLLDAVRVCVFNLTNTPPITVHNRSGYTNGVPYVQTHQAVPPGSFVDMTIEFHSPMRLKPNPVLQAELVPPASVGSSVEGGAPQAINRVKMLANKTFMIEFPTLSNRVYSIQYSSNLVHWKSVQPALSGNGNWVQWIDNGQPKTDSPPAAQATRFYRLLLLP